MIKNSTSTNGDSVEDNLHETLEKERLKIALEAGRLGTWEWDIKSNKVYWSESTKKIHGYFNDNFEATFEIFLKGLHPNDLEYVSQKIKKALKSNEKYHLEYRIIRPDGKIRWLETQGVVIKKGNSPIKMLGVCTDITAKKEIQNRLRVQYLIAKDLAKSSNLTEVAPNILEKIGQLCGWQAGILWLVSENGKMLRLSKAWTEDKNELKLFQKENESLSYSKKSGIVGKVWQQNKPIWVPDIRKSKNFKRKNIAKKAGLKTLYAFPIEIDGKVVGIIEFFSKDIKKTDRSLIAILETLRHYIDQVIERQDAEQENIKIKNQLEAVFANVPVGITVEKEDGTIVYANEKANEFLGFDNTSPLQGVNIKKVFNKFRITDENGIRQSFSNRPAITALENKKGVVKNLHFINKQTYEEKWFSVQAGIVDSSEDTSKLVIKSFDDITDILESRGQSIIFGNIIRKDIKRSLASIKAYTQLIQRRLKTKEYDKVSEYSGKIEIQLENLTESLSNLRDITEITVGKFILNKRKLDIDKTVDKVVKNFASKKGDYVFNRKGRLAYLSHVDEDRLAQVLNNILTNAIEHSGGRRVDVETLMLNEKIGISIKDYGVGIPKKYHRSIFKPSSAKSKNGNGKEKTGIGLTVSKEIIKSLGGDLIFKSTRGKGSEFIVLLPTLENNK